MPQLVVWTLDSFRYALPLEAVERVLLPVAVTPLPDAPPGILGVIDVAGRLTPVYDMRRRLQLPPQPLRLSDRLLLARARNAPAAFFADSVEGACQYDAALERLDTMQAAGSVVAGVVRLADGLVLIEDLDRFLTLDEAQRLQLALAHAA